MQRSINTPRNALACSGLPAVLALAALCGAPLGAQAPASTPLLDALSITVQVDSVEMARGSARFRQIRSGTDVELVANGIIEQRGRGLRLSSELRTDSTYTLRRYLAETRDSSGTVIDRIQVRSAGGRITYERTTPTRRIMREFAAQRDLMILDSASVVPFMALAGVGQRATVIPLLDVRSGRVKNARLTPGTSSDLPVAEAMVRGTPITVAGLSSPLRWWRDAKGRLLRVTWGERSGVFRNDPPT